LTYFISLSYKELARPRNRWENNIKMHIILNLSVQSGLIWLRMGFRDEICGGYDDSLGRAGVGGN
jgi:hypothetical protein